ncbi:MAG: hypothetical protein KA954_09920 [Chitinophagales bacterium]|nr:hypothetical protein [Chitinophagales bacterium]MBP8753278.1 hypothetical protein [Chitinophagales bacterium]MBP9549826.1 hypothetical protein [Chitinophagales bacterium]MBP9703448.1 hypothetical protein [Chitinophagales bacterium]
MIQIDELQIRMSGNNEYDGNTIAKQVAERLAESLPEYSGTHHIPELKVQMQLKSLDDSAQFANQIAEQIIRQIKLTTF